MKKNGRLTLPQHVALGLSILAICMQTTNAQEAAAQQASPKDIFVFFDGTKNTPKSNTNVVRLYRLITEDNKPGVLTRYFDGVGSIRFPLTGAWLGKDMEDKILDGYSFLARNYQEGDRIFIIGFSRGAHQARALAGFIAYAGIQPDDERDRRLKRKSNRILELVKRKKDADFINDWKIWTPSAGPLLGAEIKRTLGIDTRAAQVAFLGVWDTVPGSSLKKYGACKEEQDNKSGDRYKTDSYPPVKVIAHAASADEKRSKFRQTLLCPPIDSATKTETHEKWFPGAHADVGGGYEEGIGLQNISLNWMIGQLSAHYAFRERPPSFDENPLDDAHWSISDAPANAFSDCEDRIIPQGADRSDAIAQRTDKTVPLWAFNEKEPLKLVYPVGCKDLGKTRN